MTDNDASVNPGHSCLIVDTAQPRDHAACRVAMTGYRELDGPLVDAWRDLEARALEKNAYLSPDFVLPAVRCLTGDRAPIFLFVHREDQSGRQVIGVGVFASARPKRYFPLNHLTAYRCAHSFLSGLLVDREYAADAIRHLCRFLFDPRQPWHGVEFVERSADGELDRLLVAAAAEHGTRWREYERARRAILVPAEAGEACLEAMLSPARVKELRRAKRRLGERGTVGWRAVRGEEIDDGCVTRFLELEDSGWKRQHKCSLRARAGHEAFFREMTESFARRGGAFFTELQVGERVIASTSNLISGNAGFAFKLGWHEEFSRLSPGLLNEVEFVRHAPELFASLDYIDSGAVEGSFIERLWARRRILTSGIYPTSVPGKAAIFGLDAMRRLKRWRKSR